MELIFYPDHDKRYAHISKEFRRQYPDAVRRGIDEPPIERKYTYAELRAGVPLEDSKGNPILGKDGKPRLVQHRIEARIRAKDVPIKDAMDDYD